MANADAGAFSGGGGGGGTGMNYVAGEAIDITKKSNTGTISVKYDGSSIILNENGELMANIPEPEPTELYNAGDGIDINDRVISVKHDETITVNESGQLHVVNSGGGGGGSDSLFHKQTHKWTGTIDWGEFNQFATATIDDGRTVQFNEYENFPFDACGDDGVIVRFFTDDEQVGECTITMKNGDFICPFFDVETPIVDSLNPTRYVNMGKRIGVLGPFGGIWDYISLSHTIKTEDNISYTTIEPIEQLPIKATKIIAPGIPEHEDGVVNPFVSFNNLTEIQKSFGDVSTNYMYINNCETTMSPQNILNIVLPNTIHDAEYNPLGNVICSLSHGKWIVPVINKTDSHYTVEHHECDEGPGIAITIISESPKKMVLKGDIFIEWLPEPSRCSFNETIKCPIIEADNALKLFKSPVPFFYIPKLIGETTIDNLNYWYIDYGFGTDSQEFKNLVNGQPFEFIDNAFGHHFVMKKESTGWTGNNFQFKTHNQILEHGSKNDDGAIIGFMVTDINKFVIKQEFGLDINSNVFTQLYNSGKLKFYNHSGNDMQISIVSEGSYPFHASKPGHGMIFSSNQVVMEKFTAKLISDSGKVNIEFTWGTNEGGITNLCSQIKYEYESSLTESNPGGTLRLYIMKNCYEKVNEDIDYTDMNYNPFGFLVEKEYYDIIPKPESCSTLMTNYNIQTSGIVIGANIESHAFTLNKLGNSVETIIVDVDNINNELSAIASEVVKVSSELDNYIMMDMLFGFAELGMGVVTGVIAAGSKGAFKFGEKSAIKSVEGGEKGVCSIGEDFSKVSIESELSVSSIAPKTGESAVKVNGDIVCSGTIRGNQWKFAEAEGSSIEMSAENIRVSGPCEFESEVSGNSALFDSFSTSETGSVATNSIRPVNSEAPVAIEGQL